MIKIDLNVNGRFGETAFQWPEWSLKDSRDASAETAEFQIELNTKSKLDGLTAFELVNANCH